MRDCLVSQVFHAVARRGLHDGMARQGEDPSPFSAFLGEPVAIYRNWDAYSYNREPEANQAQGIKQRAEAATTFLQRSRAGLMLPTEVTQELVIEEYSARGERERESLRAQGNTMLLPANAVHTQGDVTKRLVVHAGGPLMSELRLSWLCHGKREEAGAGPNADRKRQWWMMGGRSYKAEIGRLRQVELLPERGYSCFDINEDVGETWAVARAGPQALVFAVSPSGESAVRQEEEEEDDGGDEATGKGMRKRLPPYMIRPRQMLRFPSTVCSLSGWSMHRAALLTSDLKLYEWSGAEGVLPCHQLSTPTAVTGVGTIRAREFEPQVCWGSHAGSVWVGVGAVLLHVDLRAPPSSARHVEAMGQLPCGERGGVEGAGIGALAAHPGRENVIFASARASLVALDVRCLRGPLEVLPQSETSTLLHAHPLPPPSTGPADAMLLASGQRTSRVHVHVPLPHMGPAAQRRVLDTWHADTMWLDPPSTRPLPAHATLTCLNVDCHTQRSQPVYLSGLGLAITPSSGRQREAALLQLSSLGDMYMQRLGTRHHLEDDEDELSEPLPTVPRSSLPCGLSLHAACPSPSGPLLPSTAIPQPRDPSTLRSHLLVPVTPSSFLPPAPNTDASLGPPSRVLTPHMRSSMSALLSDGPRTLAQLQAHLSTLPSSSRTQPPPIRVLLRLLRGEQALRSTLCGGGGSDPAMGPSPAARRQAQAHVIVEGEEKEGGGCRCVPPPASSPQAQTVEPCDAPGCVIPHSILFWRAPVSMEEGGLRVRRRERQGPTRGAGQPSAFSGLDTDTVEWLKGRWKDNEEEEEQGDN